MSRFHLHVMPLCLLVGLLTGSLWAPGVALAQAPSSEAGEEDIVREDDQPSSRDIEEIVVSGSAGPTSAQSAATAITEFKQAELDSMGIIDVASMSLSTPSLHVGNVGSQSIITLRGIGAQNLTAVGEAGVGFEVDGIHQGRPAVSTTRFFDLEYVRVLKGPQGQNGGRQTNGGRIALRSVPPEEDMDFFGDFQVGAYDNTCCAGWPTCRCWTIGDS